MCVGFTLGQKVTMRVGPTLRFGVRNGHLDEMQFGSDLSAESTIARQWAEETANRNMWKKQPKVTD